MDITLAHTQFMETAPTAGELTATDNGRFDSSVQDQ